MEDSIADMLRRMEINIERCEVLSNILADRLNKNDMDMGIYMRKGYSEDEINIGVEIIDLYLGLISLIEKSEILI